MTDMFNVFISKKSPTKTRHCLHAARATVTFLTANTARCVRCAIITGKYLVWFGSSNGLTGQDITSTSRK